MSNENRNFLREFIRTYKSLPSIWDLASPHYTNKRQKTHDYEILLHKYKEFYPQATIADVKKKINVLRTCFFREKRRITEINKNETVPSELSEPTLWYYNELKFIKHIEKNEQDTKNDTQSASVVEPATRPKRRRDNSPCDELIRLAAQRLSQPPDEFNKIADVWASKLRKMNSAQQIYAERAINEVLFEGLLGNLHRNSLQIINKVSTSANTSQNKTLVYGLCNDRSTPNTFEAYDIEDEQIHTEIKIEQ